MGPSADGPGFVLRAVLGPPRGCPGAEQAIDVGGLKARALVSRLLIDRNLTVSGRPKLLDSLWTDHEGDGAEIALRSTISRLRKRLRDAGVESELIVTRAPGYVLTAEAEATDVHQFERLVADGRKDLARGRPTKAVRVLKEAQEMWRGSAYSEVRDEPFARAEARRLEELLLTAIEVRIDAELTLGGHNALVGELEALTNDNPMRERLWSQRMLALYRSGRQAEALRVFQELRNVLVSELGIEPGNDVAWMEQAILMQDPALDFAVPEEDTSDPRDEGDGLTLPTGSLAYHSHAPSTANEGPLVGREAEVAAMREWWDAVQRGETRLLLVEGEAGIGKTRLVSEFAQRAEGGGCRFRLVGSLRYEDPVAPFPALCRSAGSLLFLFLARQRYLQNARVASW